MSHAHEAEHADWPTTLRFSRRLGEAVRGVEYAMAIEGPRPPRVAGHGFANWWARVRSHALGRVVGRAVGQVLRPH